MLTSLTDCLVVKSITSALGSRRAADELESGEPWKSSKVPLTPVANANDMTPHASQPAAGCVGDMLVLTGTGGGREPQLLFCWNAGLKEVWGAAHEQDSAARPLVRVKARDVAVKRGCWLEEERIESRVLVFIFSFFGGYLGLEELSLVSVEFRISGLYFPHTLGNCITNRPVNSALI